MIELSSNIRECVVVCGELNRRIVESMKLQTENGRLIDDFQPPCRRLAQLSTLYEAACAAASFGEAAAERAKRFEPLAIELFAGEVAREFCRAVTEEGASFGFGDEAPSRVEELRTLVSGALTWQRYAELGRAAIDSGGTNDGWIFAGKDDSHEEQDLRESTRRFAETAIAPHAESIHREDLTIPDAILEHVAEMGFFGMSVPEQYGGVGMSNLMMIVATEELSTVSLGAAGSLITRPEILTKALLAGGTEAQREKWLPRVASGECLVAISVTEPNIGSDVASVSCRATETTADDVHGYVINGAKAWCTFAGRADIIGLLARTDPDVSKGHRGLSLFIVEKEVSHGHEFEIVQPSGGRLTGKADATLGYRGMHSYTLQFEDYFVPAENLVGEEGGKGKGFYLQMGGFAAGRLQTGGRALGVAQASLKSAVKYAAERPQFGKPIAEFQNTQYEIGRMASQIEGARQLTYAAARAMDAKDDRATVMAAMSKLHASRVAVDVSQRAQLLHGGWGYAEEYPISRYVVDALVLPIFEGVEPILEMKVIARGLLGEG